MICKDFIKLPSFFDFKSSNFDKYHKELYDECARIESGKITNYTDYLSKVDDQFAVSICSVDGQKMGLGPHNKMFTMQSLIVRVCKEFSNVIRIQHQLFFADFRHLLQTPYEKHRSFMLCVWKNMGRNL